MTGRVQAAVVLLVGAVVILIAGLVLIFAGSSAVYRVPVSCTRAALLATQNELEWQARDQAHVDVEGNALDGTTRKDFEAALAGLPQVPQPVDLTSCEGKR